MAVRLTNYIFTPKDLIRMIKSAGKKNLLGWALLLLVAMGLRIKLGFSWESLVFVEFTIMLFFWKINSRLSIGLALAYLVLIPVLLALSYGPWPKATVLAEKSAIWAFYLLSIGVVKQGWEFLAGRQGKLAENTIITPMLKYHARFLEHRQNLPPAPAPALKPQPMVINPHVQISQPKPKQPKKRVFLVDGIALRTRTI